MAALTWREVSNPNFGSSNDLLRTGVQLQQNALSGIGDAIESARKQQTAGIDSAVLARALQVNDPAAYQRSLSDGSFLAGVNPSQVSPETLGALGSRATALLGQANTRQSMEGDAYKQQRTQSLDQIQDAARPATARAYGITDPQVANLPSEQQLAVAAGNLNLRRGEQGLRQGEVNITGGELNNVNSAFRNRTQLRNDNAQQGGLAAGVDVLRSSADAQDALGGLEGKILTPQEFQVANQYLQGSFGNLYAPAAAPAPGGGGARPGTQSGSPYDTTFNFQGTARPISQSPIGQVLDVQEQSKSTQGHSPMGAFQINKATLEDYGPKVLGENWKEQDFSPEAQEKLAKAIFEDRKGGDLSKTWAALPNNSPGAYKDFTWDDIRSVISNGEVGQNLPSDRASLNLLTQMSQQEYKRRQSQNNSVGVTADVEKNYGDIRAPGEVVQELIKNQLPSADPDKLLGLVSKIRRDNPNLSAADAGSIIARSVDESAYVLPDGTTQLGGGLFSGVGVIDDAIKKNTEDYKLGQADKSSLGNALTRNDAARLDSAKESYDNAFQNLMQLNQRQRIQPGISTDRAENAFRKAEAALKKALQSQRQEPESRPVR